MWNFSVTTSEELRNLCIRNDYFTSGDIEQYKKLFYANRNGFPIEEIATIIWICSSNVCKEDILEELKKAHEEYILHV